MKLKTILFIGRSGCGKGTQGKLLEKYITGADSEIRRVFYLETGSGFRKFFAGENYSNKIADLAYKKGDRAADFLAIWNWSHILIENLEGNEHIIIDGTPRSYHEATIFDTAIDFYSRENPTVIHLEVSRDWSKKHLMARGRDDDKSEAEVDKRLDWYEKDVIPAVEYFKINPKYNFIEVNGEQSIEKVHEEILAKLGKD